MTEYLIAFNDEWVPDHTVEEMREKSKAVRALVAEMKAAGVFIFTGGLDDAAPVFSVDASSGTPLITDGPYAETKRAARLHLRAQDLHGGPVEFDAEGTRSEERRVGKECH